MEKWLKTLKEKLKAGGNLCDDEDDEDNVLDEDGAGAGTLITGIPREKEVRMTATVEMAMASPQQSGKG